MAFIVKVTLSVNSELALSRMLERKKIEDKKILAIIVNVNYFNNKLF